MLGFTPPPPTVPATPSVMLAQWGMLSSQNSAAVWYLLMGGPNTVVQAANTAGRFVVRAPLTINEIVFQHELVSGAAVDNLRYTVLRNGAGTAFSKVIASNDTTPFAVAPGPLAVAIGDVIQVTVQQSNPVSQLVRGMISAWGVPG